ncbi:hypothetical protein GCM10009835_09260 [Planosporangium flavigriseum]
MVPSRIRAGTSWLDVYEHFLDVESAALAEPAAAPVTDSGTATATAASSPTTARRRLTKTLVARTYVLLRRPTWVGQSPRKSTCGYAPPYWEAGAEGAQGQDLRTVTATSASSSAVSGLPDAPSGTVASLGAAAC